MVRFSKSGCIAGLLAVVFAGTAFAQDATASKSADDVGRLEALLEAQQAKIDALEQRLVAADAQDQDAARMDVMRDQIRSILSEQEFRESLIPSLLQAGYDDGFFIRSTDDMFMLKVNGLMQFRWTHYGTQSDNEYLRPGLERDDRTGFDLARIRMRFSGHAYDPNLTYWLEIAADEANGYAFFTDESWVNYAFSDEFQLRAGLITMASTRGQMLDDSRLQFVDRPMVDAVFGLGTSLGVRFWGQLFDKRLDWYVDIVNSFSNGEGLGAGRTITPDPAQLDSNPGIVARLVWHAMGDDPGTHFVAESDIDMSASPALDIGMHYAFNDDAGDLLTTRLPVPLRRNFRGGGFGLVSSNGTQIHQLGVDSSFKYMGFSAHSEYIVRIIDPRRAGRRPFAPWWLASNQGDATTQHGAYVQLGYFLPIPGLENKLELVARTGAVSAIANEQNCAWEYSAGMNYYIQEDRVKLQADLTKITEVPISSSYYSLANVNDDALIFRIQLQLAF